MAITHDGRKIPKFPESWDANSQEWVSIAWDEDVACHGAIVAASSVWVLPTNWTAVSEQEDVPVIDCDGTTYDHSNQALLSTTDTEGIFILTNRVQFADLTILDRSVKVTVKPT